VTVLVFLKAFDPKQRRDDRRRWVKSAYDADGEILAGREAMKRAIADKADALNAMAAPGLGMVVVSVRRARRQVQGWLRCGAHYRQTVRGGP